MRIVTEFASERDSKKSRRRHKKAGPMLPVVQRLFDTCQEVFSGEEAPAGAVPSPVDVARIKSILDSMTGADVGLSPNMRYFRNNQSQGIPPITYLHLHECDDFSIGIFCLPPSGVIPLHNHPGMTVFSKILFGSMHIKSYDWADPAQDSNGFTNHTNGRPAGGARLARVKVDADFRAPCETLVLYPMEGGNMHQFRARDACALLDVLGPPYSDEEGRHCTYYNDISYSNFPGVSRFIQEQGEGYAWLEERDRPDNFIVVGAPYRGPQIIDH